MATNEQKKQILIDYLDATFAGDIEGIGAHLTEDFTIWMVPSAKQHGMPIPLQGRQTFMEFVRNLQARPTFWKPRAYEVNQFYFDGDAAAIWVRFLGDFPGGYPYDNEYVFTFRFVGDKICEKREFTDTVHIAHQNEQARAHAAQAG